MIRKSAKRLSEKITRKQQPKARWRFDLIPSRFILAGRRAVDRPRQAARTEPRNLLTSSLSRLLSPASDFAAVSTWDEAEPVWLAPRCTSAMLAETCWVPCAAC